MRFGSGGGLSGEVLPAPEDAADVAVGDAHGHDGHHVGQDEVEDVVSVKQSMVEIVRLWNTGYGTCLLLVTVSALTCIPASIPAQVRRASA